jgi:hypothetical protein
MRIKLVLFQSVRSIILHCTLFLILIVSACNQKSEWKSLFNGNDLSGWDIYLGPSFDILQGKRDSIPFGLNNDPLQVFSVVQEDGQPALRISGERFGGISTTGEFKNYHLQMEFKWGTLKWPPRKNSKRDSGLLYHAVGAHGADYGFWMRSQEFQIQEGDCGDYWGVAGGLFDVPSSKDSIGYVYDSKATLITFSENQQAGRHCIKNPDAEKPTGQWNTIEIYCLGDTTVHIVNGVVNMVLYNSRQLDGAKESPLTKGKIQLQSEGAEVFYRNINLQPVTQLPESLTKGL